VSSFVQLNSHSRNSGIVKLSKQVEDNLQAKSIEIAMQRDEDEKQKEIRSKKVCSSHIVSLFIVTHTIY
jgi:hypothetical protein